MHFWAAYGDAQLYEYIVVQTGERTALDAFENSPLHYSAMFEKIDTAAVILTYNRDGDVKDVQNEFGQYPLHLACQTKCIHT